MVDFERGKKAVTHFDVIERTLDEKERPYSLVALCPITGRSHQLRVHMLALGHPILGDSSMRMKKRYPWRLVLQLHAESFEFFAPNTLAIGCTLMSPSLLVRIVQSRSQKVLSSVLTLLNFINRLSF